MTEPPCHIVAEPGDRRTLCGRDTRRREGWPYIWARFVHQRRSRLGDAFDVCSDCWVLVDLDAIKAPT